MAQGINGHNWGPLLEKAYAKFVGSYDLISNAGSTNEFIRLLTGLPGFTFVTKKTANAVAIIREALNQGDIVTCGTPSKQTFG